MTSSNALRGAALPGLPLPVPLEPLLARVLQSFEETASTRGMQLSLLPTPAIVGSDPLLLECTVHALVAHCVKHPDSVSVALSVRTRGEDFELQVWNSRPTRPRPSSLLPSAPELPAADTEERPADLDLQLARDCARRLRHPLVIRERRGAGVRFSIRLPDAERAARDPLASLRILLATDTEPSRRGWKDILDRWGCTVVPPPTHHEVREPQAGEESLDLIVCDTMRDVQEAIEWVERLRDCAGRDLPAILLSSDTSLEGSRRVRRADIRHLRKPVAPQRLEALIRQLLSQRP